MEPLRSLLLKVISAYKIKYKLKLLSIGFEIGHITDGSYFGEIGLLKPNQKQTATVMALETCEIYRLTREDFNYVIQPHSDIWQQMNDLRMQEDDENEIW